MKKKRHLLSLAGGALCLMLLTFAGGAALAPAPAYAVAVTDAPATAAESAGLMQDIINWAKNNAVSQAISQVTHAILDSLISWFQKTLYYIEVATASENAAQSAFVEARTRLTQGVIDSEVMGVYHRSAMRVRADHFQPPGQGLCNNTLIGQMPLTTEAFEQTVSRAALSAIEGMYRGEKDEGDGPQYARDHQALRCGKKFGSPIDYPKECVDNSTTGAMGRKIYDADLTFETLAGGEQVLELPPFDTVEDKDGNKFLVPNATTPAQRFWEAGLHYCFNLAGPRPTPPHGKELDTPQGRVKKTKWDICAAKQSKLIEPCTKLLAHHTRPTQTMTKLIEAQKKKCLAAEKEKVKLPESFEKCAYGLSPYQSDFLTQSMCRNPSFVIAQSLAGSTHPRMIEASVDCATSWTLWEETELALEMDVIDGINGLLDLRECWQGVNK